MSLNWTRPFQACKPIRPFLGLPKTPYSSNLDAATAAFQDALFKSICAVWNPV